MGAQSEAGLLGLQVQVGDQRDHGDDLLGPHGRRLPLHLANALLHTAGRQPGLGLVVPAVLDGLAQHGQALPGWGAQGRI